jgi:hypothetical protein
LAGWRASKTLIVLVVVVVVDWAFAVAVVGVVRIRWFVGVTWQLHQSTVTDFPA